MKALALRPAALARATLAHHSRSFALASRLLPPRTRDQTAFVYAFCRRADDEAFHWRRYVRTQADPVEMWSHVGILVGHGVMMAAWWRCYQLGYPGVREALAALGAP